MEIPSLALGVMLILFIFLGEKSNSPPSKELVNSCIKYYANNTLLTMKLEYFSAIIDFYCFNSFI